LKSEKACHKEIPLSGPNVIQNVVEKVSSPAVKNKIAENHPILT
jgi:hypothetical protein